MPTMKTCYVCSKEKAAPTFICKKNIVAGIVGDSWQLKYEHVCDECAKRIADAGNREQLDMFYTIRAENEQKLQYADNDALQGGLLPGC